MKTCFMDKGAQSHEMLIGILRDTHKSRYDLFILLKQYESNVLKSDSQIFDMAKIGALLDEFEEKAKKFSARHLWSGSIDKIQFKSILNFSLVASDALLCISRVNDWFDFLQFCISNQRKSLVLSDWGYPFGGAEAFFLETVDSLFELGFLVEWGHFQIPGIGGHEKNEVINHEKYIEYKYKDFPNLGTLSKIVKRQKPDLLFSHGSMNQELERISSDFGIPLIEGFHFWTGLVALANNSNMNIRGNLSQHHLTPTISFKKPPGSQKYLVSRFMLEVYKDLGGNDDYLVIDPSFDFDSANDYCGLGNGWVSQLDVSVGKGGHIFCDLVERLGDRIAFMAVVRETTEPEIKNRLSQLSEEFPSLRIQGYSDIATILQNSKLILVPSLVDETFSRVAVEAVHHGIPALTSKKGNLNYLFDGIGSIEPMSIDLWESRVASICDSNEEARSLWQNQSDALRSTEKNSKNMIDLILDSVEVTQLKRVGIFSVNAPQGLGTLGKILLESCNLLDLEPFIFAFSPYDKRLSLENYWHDSPRIDSNHIRISSRTRETVTLEEILEFIDGYKLQVFIFPEVCWIDNWKRLYDIKRLRPEVQIIIMPMLETVIDYEVSHLNDFDLTLFPTKQSKVILENHGVGNGKFVGFTSPVERHYFKNLDSNLGKMETNKIKFLHIAGHNPTLRKRTITVINEFLEALKFRKDISLTITIQNLTADLEELNLPPEVRIITENLSDSEIADLYVSHDVSIQIPSHEGIGIGFYESISLGTPVVSLDTPPHNEVVIPKYSGWLLPVRTIRLPDNLYGLVNAAEIIPGALTNFIIDLKDEDLKNTISVTHNFYLENFSNLHFTRNLASSLFLKKVRGQISTNYDFSRIALAYQRLFNIVIRLGKKYVYSNIPISTNQKFYIKDRILKLDRLVRKIL